MAGFGGQGILFMGKLLAQLMMEQGKQITYFPSYGAEVRGGTANCHVIISDDDIHSPVADTATTLIIMNAPSYERFAPLLEDDGLMILNTSMVQKHQPVERGTIIEIPATDEANALGNVRIANMLMLGAYLERRKILPMDVLIDYLPSLLGARKAQLLEINVAALRRGQELARSE